MPLKFCMWVKALAPQFAIEEADKYSGQLRSLAFTIGVLHMSIQRERDTQTDRQTQRENVGRHDSLLSINLPA